MTLIPVKTKLAEECTATDETCLIFHDNQLQQVLELILCF